MVRRTAVLAAFCLLSLAGVGLAQGDAGRAEAEKSIDRLLGEADELCGKGRYLDALGRAQAAVEVSEEAFGHEHPVTADCLGWLGGMLKALGRLDEAKEAQERALAIQEKTLGPDHPSTAASLSNLANVLREMGDLRGARPLLERSLAIREKAFGPEDARVATCLVNLALVLHDLGEMAGAKALYERALAIEEKTLGAEDPDLAITLANYAGLLRGMGEVRAARPILERVLSIQEKALGPEHPETATSLNDLGLALQDLGDLEEARRFLERALGIREKALGPEHPDVSISLTNFAMLLRDLGDLSGARPLLQRALAIREKKLGPRHPDTAGSLLNLAGLHRLAGDLTTARGLLERALTIHEETLGRDHHRTALDLRGLGSVLHAMGDSRSARPLFERALAIDEKVLGPDHPSTGQCLGDLAVVLRAQGDLGGARRLLERVLVIREKSGGADHPGVAQCLNNLGAVLAALGEADEARGRFDRALRIWEKSLGPDHPLVALVCNNLAGLARGQGDLAEARSLCERACSIAGKALGEEHPDSAVYVYNLALALGGPEEAAGRQALARVWAADRGFLRDLLPALSSRERFAALRGREERLDVWLSAQSGDASASWATALEWKGVALRASVAALRRPRGASEEQVRAAEELMAARTSLARLVLASEGEGAVRSTLAERFQAARKRVEELERGLSAAGPEIAARLFPQGGPEDARQGLPEGAVLLDLLQTNGRIRAWVVRRDRPIESPLLGDASQLASWAEDFRKAVQGDDEKAWREAGEKLRAWLEAPLAAALADARALYIAPDGVLATIPWGLLPEGDGFLIERLPVVCVDGGAPLVNAAASDRGELGKGLLALGGVDYSGLDRPFTSLSETKGEVELVAKRFQAKFAEAPCSLVTGKAGDEATFRQEAPKARYVHVATHGFFDLDNMRVAVGAATRGLSGKSATPLEMARDEGLDLAGWNPLLLSGLVLAPSKDGDGYVTAEELQDLDLRGVELVVLSACETGRGELAAGEGVLGLSRALAIAGARQFMLSLWKVPDAETSELMDAFYKGLWEDGLPAEEALRRAQLAMLACDREKGVFRPSAWGAWVLTR